MAIVNNQQLEMVQLFKKFQTHLLVWQTTRLQLQILSLNSPGLMVHLMEAHQLLTTPWCMIKEQELMFN